MLKIVNNVVFKVWTVCKNVKIKPAIFKLLAPFYFILAFIYSATYLDNDDGYSNLTLKRCWSYKLFNC